MADYRLYFLDQANHNSAVVEFGSDDDEAALDEARGHADGRTMELWNRDRLIQRFERGPEPP